MKKDVWAATSPAPFDGMPDVEPPRSSPLLDAKVMMVDDEPLMTDLIQAHLEDAGYSRFVVSNDPLDAIELLRREEPGVLLLDLMMPQRSGFEVLEAIRADPSLRYTPVIVLTAASGAASKLRALQLGASDFLSKPVDASELALRVRNTLAYHQYHNRMINFDPVTNLPYEKLFDRGIDELLSRRDSDSGMTALFSITVPECRQLREGIDQASANALASAFARRLERFEHDERKRSTRATLVERSPRVARLGAEQFGMLFEGMAGPDEVEALARRLIAAVSDPIRLGPHDIAPTLWIGISVSPADGDSAQMLRKSADLAASRVRELGAGRFKFASAEMNEKSRRQLTLGLQLRGAVQRGELRLHYQPKLDVASNRIVGAEALVRWQHPSLGLLQPANFITLAEELGLIGGIGDWVIDQACKDLADWTRQGLGRLKMAVNVAKPQFTGEGLAASLRRAMFDHGVAPSQLVIELTESMLMDDALSSIGMMQDLKMLGVTLSIDDFGTGYSSLSYLKRFPLDELKIDRSFVSDLPGEKADSAIVKAVIDLGHSLGMSVTAEGIETAEQLASVSQMGCDLYQGYLFSKPIPAEAFVRLLSADLAAVAVA